MVIGQSALAALPVANASTATLTIQNLPAGQDSITAYYAGDTVFASGTSNPLAINVQGFTLAPSATNPPTNLNIVQGGSGSESFMVTNVGGYTGQVQVVCAVALQDDMTCTPTPQQVTPTATVTFAVQTFVTGGPLYAAAVSQPTIACPPWPQAAGGAALAALVFFLLPFGRRARTFLRQGPRHFIILLTAPGRAGRPRYRLHQHARSRSQRHAARRCHAQSHGHRLRRQRCHQPERLLHRERAAAVSADQETPLPIQAAARSQQFAVLRWHFAPENLRETLQEHDPSCIPAIPSTSILLPRPTPP